MALELCGLRGQKGWIPRQEDPNPILDALIQNLGSTLLPFFKKKSFARPKVSGSVTNCRKGSIGPII